MNWSQEYQSDGALRPPTHIMRESHTLNADIQQKLFTHITRKLRYPLANIKRVFLIARRLLLDVRIAQTSNSDAPRVLTMVHSLYVSMKILMPLKGIFHTNGGVLRKTYAPIQTACNYLHNKTYDKVLTALAPMQLLCREMRRSVIVYLHPSQQQ